MKSRLLVDKTFRFLSSLMAWFGVFILGFLIYTVSKDGFPWLNWNFITSFPSRFPDRSGIYSALMGSLWIISLTALIAVPLGITTALYMEEYMKKNKFYYLVQLNISALAGMPSIVYGLLGLAIFVRFLGLDRSIISGALTLSLLIVPIIIIASQGAIRSVPRSLREGAYALGVNHHHVVFGQVLPAASPGIMTGVILAISRAMGESAPLILIGALSYIAFAPVSPMDPFTVLPIQIFNWAGRPQADFHGIAAAGIIVLLTLLLIMNMAAIFIRHRYQRYL